MDFIKKHVKPILLLVAALIFLSWYVLKKESDYFTHLNRITKKYIHKMEKEYGLSCFSIGGSVAVNIKEVSLKFTCCEQKSIEEARVLELACIEQLREMINSNEKIRLHLEEYPFTNERVEIMIRFREKSLKNFPPENSISRVTSCKGKLFYDNVFNDHRPDQTVLEETFTEAYEKADRLSIEQAKRGWK